MSAALDVFIATLRLRPTSGVSDEIGHFMPSGWSWKKRAGAFQVTGPWSDKWLIQVRELCGVLAYREGSLLRQLSERHHEFFTWRNDELQGFKVVFRALPEPTPHGEAMKR